MHGKRIDKEAEKKIEDLEAIIKTTDTMAKVILRGPALSVAVVNQAMEAAQAYKDAYPILQEEWLAPSSVLVVGAFYLGLLTWDIYAGQYLTLRSIDSRRLAPEISIRIDEDKIRKLIRIRPHIKKIEVLYESTIFSKWDKLRHSVGYFRYVNKALEGSLFSSTVTQALAFNSPIIAKFPVIQSVTQITINLASAVASMFNLEKQNQLFQIIEDLSKIEPPSDYDHDLQDFFSPTTESARQAVSIENRTRGFNWSKIKVRDLVLPGINYGIYGATLALNVSSPIFPFLSPHGISLLGFYAMYGSFFVSGIQGCRDELWQQLKFQVFEDAHTAQFGSRQTREVASISACKVSGFKALGDALWTLYTAISVANWLRAAELIDDPKAEAFFTLIIFIVTYALSLIDLIPRYKREHILNRYIDPLMSNEEMHILSPSAHSMPANYVPPQPNIHLLPISSEATALTLGREGETTVMPFAETMLSPNADLNHRRHPEHESIGRRSPTLASDF